MSTWDVSVNGTPLNTEGTGVTDITGLGSISGRDFYNQSTFAIDGESSVFGGLSAGVWGMTILVDGVSRSTGLVPSDSTPEAEAQANLEWLAGLFANDYLLNIALTLPPRSGQSELVATRVCSAQLMTMSGPRWNDQRTYCYVTLGFKIPDVYWRAAGGGTLDAGGWASISVPAGTTSLTLPTSTFPMNGFIEDAIIKIQNSTNPIKTVSVKAINLGSGTNNPEMKFTTTRTNGVVYASADLTIDCKAHTAIHHSGSTNESVMKYASWQGGRPGSMLRIGKPYTITLALTPYTSGASMAGVSWTFKYRPSFI